MPRWDFKCPRCGQIKQDVSDRHLEDAKCYCVSNFQIGDASYVPMEKLPCAPNFRLVGSGFHKNDYPTKDK